MPELNWGLLQQPDIAGNAFASFARGQKIGQERVSQNAMMAVMADPKNVQAQRVLSAVDPERGMAFEKSARERATYARTDAARAAAAPFIAKGDYRGAAQAEASGDPDAAKTHLDFYNSLSERDQKISDASDDVIASAYPALKAMPVGSGERKAFWDATVAPRLKQIGAPADVVDTFDPDNQAALDARYAHAIGAKGMQEQGNADRSFGLEKDRFGHTVEHDAATLDLQRDQFGEARRHNKVDEGQGAQRIGLEGARLGEDRRHNQAAEGATTAERQQKITEAQAKDGFNAKRLSGAAQTLRTMEAGHFDPSLSGAGSAVALPQSRQYQAAKGEWADAIIRLTTGAAATSQEIAAADQAYFAQPGDAPDVRKQKAAARDRVERDALTRAGPGAAGVAGPPSQTTAVQTPWAQRR
jgi:hypothetical protein